MFPPHLEAPRADVTGIVLAGGQSMRMGVAKATLDIGGEPLLDRVTRRLSRAFARVLVVGPAGLHSLALDHRIVPDLHPGLGPLGGLESALATAETPWVFVVACDMPFVSPVLARHMSALAAATPDVEAVALVTDGRPEPLHTVYSAACLPTAREQIASGQRSLHRLLEWLHVLLVPASEATSLDPHRLSAFNANTPAEWSRALSLAARYPDA